MASRRLLLVIAIAALWASAGTACLAQNDDGFESDGTGAVQAAKPSAAPLPAGDRTRLLPAAPAAAVPPPEGPTALPPRPELPSGTISKPGQASQLPIPPEVQRNLDFTTNSGNKARLAELGIDPASVQLRQAIVDKIGSGDNAGLRAAIFTAARQFPDDPTFRALSLIVDPHVSREHVERVLERLALEGSQAAEGTGHSFGVTGAKGGRRRPGANSLPPATLRELAALATKGQHGPAVALLSRALEKSPDNAFLLDARTVERRRLHDYQGAEEDSLAALRLNPRDPDALRNRAQVMLGLQRFDEARRWADQALQVDPLDATALVTRGAAMFPLGRPDLGVEAYRRAARIDPNYYREFQQLRQKEQASVDAAATTSALRRIDAGDYVGALRQADAVLASDPSDVHGHELRGLALAKLGRDGPALLEANAALRLQPRNANMLELRASIFQRLGYKNRAEADYKVIRSIDPTFRL